MEDPKNEALLIRSLGHGNIYQPIATRTLSRTNTRPERIAVTAGMGVRRVFSRTDLVDRFRDSETGIGGYTVSQLHREAARRLISELAWPRIDFWSQGGQLGKFDHVFTCCDICKCS